MYGLKYYVENNDKFDRVNPDYVMKHVSDENFDIVDENKMEFRYELRRNNITQNMSIVDIEDSGNMFIISPNYFDAYKVIEGYDESSEFYDSSYTKEYEGLTEKSKSIFELQFLITAYNLLDLDDDIRVDLHDKMYISPLFIEHEQPLNLQYKYKDKYLVVRTRSYLNLDEVYKLVKSHKDIKRDLKNIFTSVVIFLHITGRLHSMYSSYVEFEKLLNEMKEFMLGQDMDNIYLLPANFFTNIYDYDYFPGTIDDLLTKNILKDILEHMIDEIVSNNKIHMNTDEIEIREFNIPL